MSSSLSRVGSRLRPETVPQSPSWLGVLARSYADNVASVANGMIRMERTDFDAGKLVCPRCRTLVDPKTTTVSFVPMTSWDPIGDGDRRTVDAFASLPCPACDEVIRVEFIVKHDN